MGRTLALGEKKAIQRKKEEERREYSVNVDYEWFKTLVKKLKQRYENITNDSNMVVSFDGEVLRVQVGEEIEVLKGSGKPWKSTGVILMSELSKLPKRVMRHHAIIILYKDKLYFCNAIFKNIGYEE